MVLCLLTLIDLQTRRAGLSASAELLVQLLVNGCVNCGFRGLFNAVPNVYLHN